MSILILDLQNQVTPNISPISIYAFATKYDKGFDSRTLVWEQLYLIANKK